MIEAQPGVREEAAFGDGVFWRIRDLSDGIDRVLDLLGAGPEAIALAEERARSVEGEPFQPNDLRAPFRPRRIFGVGHNYPKPGKSAASGEAPPTIFLKNDETLNSPYGDVPLVPYSSTLDYEGELGVVVAAPLWGATPAAAAAAIGGYVVVNDITLREWARPETLTLAKNAPRSNPFGPWVTTADAAPKAQSTRIQSWVNGELRQSASTGAMIRPIADLLSFLSQATPLLVGDLFLAGAPTGAGANLTPPQFLSEGDIVRVEIDGLGAIENKIVNCARND
ncbi:MAG: fumarylacetoacetate hydrolase family protein [Pseudomonadota bacterium]